MFTDAESRIEGEGSIGEEAMAASMAADAVTSEADQQTAEAVEEAEQATEAEEVGTEPEGEPEGEGEEPNEAESRRLINFIKQHWNEDLSQFDSDVSALNHLIEARHLVGKHDDETKLGRLARSMGLTAEKIQSLTDAEKQQQSARKEAAKEEGLSLPEFDLLRMEVLDEKGLPRADADPAKLQKVLKVYDDSRKLLFELSQDPKRILEPILTPALSDLGKQLHQQIQQQYQQQAETQQTMQQAETFHKENAAWIYADGKPPEGTEQKPVTPAGKQFFQHLQELLNYFSIKDDAGNIRGTRMPPMDIVNAASYMVQGMQTANRQSVRAPKATAKHRAEPASGTKATEKLQPPTDMTDEDKMAWEMRQEFLRNRVATGALS